MATAPSAEAEEALSGLRGEVDAYVAELFEHFEPVHRSTSPSEGKDIRDPIQGFIHLSGLEIEVLDSPLLQRLRYIHQNALSYLLYPSAHHSRFEHSLGMAKVVEDVADSVNASQGANLFDSTTKAELRLAALLHDTGHGIFSHLSEGLIRTHWDGQFLLIQQHPDLQGKSPGEILSYLLLTSARFKGFLEEAIIRHQIGASVDRIANYIVGRVDDPKLDAYKSDLITGPLDCDKLDYLARDAYFTGIRLEVDVQHIIRNLRVWDKGGELGRILVIRVAGASFVEQMHFARLLMFPAMYHHQKVRALESEVRSLFELIWSLGDKIEEPTLRFSRVTDFLRMSDIEFFSTAEKDEALAHRARRLLGRTVYRRALHISSATVKGTLTDTNYAGLVNLGAADPDAWQALREIREAIVEEAKSSLGRTDPITVEDVWLDVPNTVKPSKDISRCYVDTGEGHPVPLRDLGFPVDDWLAAYGEHKWAAHVFCSPRAELAQAVNKAAIKVLGGEFDLEFEPRATTVCKL